MDNILVRLSPELRAAIENILKYSNNRFHVQAAKNGTELKQIGVGELNSVKLGIYSAAGLKIGHPSISKWVSKSGLPKNIKYLNGVLFLDVEPIESEALPELETEPTDEWTDTDFSWTEDIETDENETE